MNPENIQDLYTLTATQRAILFHTLFAPETGVYVEQSAFEMDDLDVPGYIQAWQHLMQRHEAFRTGFFWEEADEPLQTVVRTVDLPLTQLDWRDVSEAQQMAQLQALMAAERQRGFDLSEPPLLRLYVIQTAVNRHIVLVNHHHILFDGWSNVVVHMEIRALYDAFRRGATADLPAPTPFREYIAWLRRQDESQAKAYWQSYLGGFVEATPIPVGSGLSQSVYGAVTAYAEEKVTLPADVWAGVQALLARENITYNNFMHAVWGILLNRYSGENDLVFGTVVHGRPTELPQFDRMVGLFINVLPVRLQFSKEELVLTWLKHSHEGFVAQTQFSHISLEQIQQWNSFPRERNLFHSLFINNNPATENVGTAPSDTRSLFVQEKTNYPLNFYLKIKEVLQISYDPTLFTAVAIQRMLAHVVQIVQNIVANPTQRMADLTILPAAERQLLESWNNPAPAAATGSLVADFAARVAQSPQAVAVIDPEAGPLTYAELDARSNRLAHHLREMGLANGRIGLHLPRSLDFPVGFWAILRSGNTYVPLDPTLPEQRLAFMVADAGLDAILTHSTLQAGLPAAVSQLCIDQLALADRPTVNEPPAETALILYTSGSTGQPKGVRLPHSALHSYVQTAVAHFRLTARDKVLQFASIGFDTSLEELCPAHLAGATLVLRTDDSLSSVQTFFAFCQEHQITVLDLPTAFWHTLAIEMRRDANLHLPASVHTIIIGGERAAPEHLATWQQVAPSHVTLWNTYGPTETTIVAVACPIAGPLAVAEASLAPIGRPVASARVTVVDQYDQLAPIGAPGELLIGGPQLALGYVGLEAETQARFIADPFAAGERVYRTGDRVRFLEDGILQFVGRTDRQIKLRGHRIEPDAIEHVLNQHPDVADTAVTTRPDAQNNPQIIAYVIPRNGRTPDKQTLTSHLRQQLPVYMIPTAFVTVDAFPKTTHGKIDYRALPAPAFQAEDAAKYAAPRTPIEETLAELFGELTHAPKIGLYDNFFQLGGHSLLITQLASRIHSTFEVELSLRALFDNPTVIDMAILIEERMLEKLEALDEEEVELML